MARPLNLICDPQLADLRGPLEDRLIRWAEGVDAEGFSDLLDPLTRKLLAGAFHWVGASEGTVWLADDSKRCLVAAFNTGPQSGDLTGFEQPLNQGIVSLVYANEQPYCENEIGRRETHDDTLDRKLGIHTGAMLAVPFYFAFGLRGVISCVQLADDTSPPPPGFDSRHVEEIANTATLVERLINSRLLMAAIGLDHV